MDLHQFALRSNVSACSFDLNVGLKDRIESSSQNFGALLNCSHEWGCEYCLLPDFAPELKGFHCEHIRKQINRSDCSILGPNVGRTASRSGMRSSPVEPERGGRLLGCSSLITKAAWNGGTVKVDGTPLKPQKAESKSNENRRFSSYGEHNFRTVRQPGENEPPDVGSYEVYGEPRPFTKRALGPGIAFGGTRSSESGN